MTAGNSGNSVTEAARVSRRSNSALESLAAAEIHKAGQRGGEAAKYLFYSMAFGGVSFLLGTFNLYEQDRDFFIRMGDMGRSLGCLGHLIALRRTLVAPFDEAQAVTLQALEAAAPASNQ